MGRKSPIFIPIRRNIVDHALVEGDFPDVMQIDRLSIATSHMTVAL